MTKLAGTIAALAGLAWLTGPIAAETTVLAWNGFGSGEGRCSTYQMTIKVNADGSKVWGDWQQKGREVRKFEFPLSPAGEFAGEVSIGGGNKMRVKGSIRGDGGSIQLTGYCNFGGRLTKG